MPDHSRPTGNPLPRLSRAAIIERLQRVSLLGELDPVARHVVTAIRVLAINSRLGRDPLPSLLHWLITVDAARAFLALADRLGTCWPERVQVLRPCCRLLSPDEATIAAMATCAQAGDRAGFAEQLDGLVRPDRHDGLFDRAVRLVASLHDGSAIRPDSLDWR